MGEARIHHILGDAHQRADKTGSGPAMQYGADPLLRVDVVCFQMSNERHRVAMGELQHRPVSLPVVEPPSAVGDVGG